MKRTMVSGSPRGFGSYEVVALLVVLVALFVGCSPTQSSKNRGTEQDSSPSELKATQSLASGQSLVAAHGPSELVMEPDGNLVLYYVPLRQGDRYRENLVSEDAGCESAECLLNRPRRMWQSGTSGHPGARLVMSPDGDLIIERDAKVVWSSGTGGNPGSSLVLTDDGDLKIRAPESRAGSVAPTNASSGRHVQPAEFSIRSATTSSAASSDLPLWATGTSTPAYVGSGLAAGAVLGPGQYLQSSNGQYELSMSTNGALTLFNLTADACPMWVQPALSWVPDGQRAQDGDEYGSPPVANSTLDMQSTDGNLVLSQPSGEALWASGTTGNPGAYMSLQDDGNLVVYSSSGTALWATSSNTYLGSALCKGEQMANSQLLLAQEFETCTGCGNQGQNWTRLQFGNDGGSGAELDSVQGNGGVTHIWRDSSAPSDVYLIMQDDGNLVIYPSGTLSGSQALWAAGTSTSGGFAALSVNGCLTIMTVAWDNSSVPGEGTLDGELTYLPEWSSCPTDETKTLGKSEKLALDTPS